MAFLPGASLEARSFTNCRSRLGSLASLAQQPQLRESGLCGAQRQRTCWELTARPWPTLPGCSLLTTEIVCHLVTLMANPSSTWPECRATLQLVQACSPCPAVARRPKWDAKRSPPLDIPRRRACAGRAPCGSRALPVRRSAFARRCRLASWASLGTGRALPGAVDRDEGSRRAESGPKRPAVAREPLSWGREQRARRICDHGEVRGGAANFCPPAAPASLRQPCGATKRRAGPQNRESCRLYDRACSGCRAIGGAGQPSAGWFERGEGRARNADAGRGHLGRPPACVRGALQSSPTSGLKRFSEQVLDAISPPRKL